MNDFFVNIISPVGEEESCQVSFIENNFFVVRVVSQHFGDLSFTGENLFVALCQFRMLIEPEGYRLLCNVARLDAYPSRMSLEMGGGRKIYLLKPGIPASRENLVDIFDKAAVGQVGTVLEQKNNHEKWIASLS